MQLQKNSLVIQNTENIKLQCILLSRRLIKSYYMSNKSERKRETGLKTEPEKEYVAHKLLMLS